MIHAMQPEITSSVRAERSHLTYILILAIVARLVTALVFFHFNRVPPVRDWGYENIAIALSICSGHGYGSPFFVPSGPTALLPPGYPLLIALVIKIFGTGTGAATILIVIQLIFSIAIVLLVFWIAQSHFGMRTGNLAGFICAICVPIFFRSLFIWDTTVSALLLIVAVWFAPLTDWSRKQAIIIGATSALAVLTNPALLPSLIAIFTWSAWRRHAKPVLAVVAFLVVFSPWPVRNAMALHSFIPFRSNFGYEFWAGNHDGTNGQFSQFDTPIYSSDERQEYLSKGELAYMREKGDLAAVFIKSHPKEFVRFCILRVVHFWMGTYDTSPSPATPALSILGLTGLALLWRRRDTFVLFALPLAIFPLLYYITHAEARFLAVVSPILAVLAAHAFESFLKMLYARPLKIATMAPQ